MNPGLVVKLRPTGPWRSGPDSGVRNRVDPVYHSDSLYAAVTSAMLRLGHLEDWLAATAHNAGPAAVRFSSCFPFADDLGFVVPPRTLWPPQTTSARVRWKSARFIPLGLVGALLSGAVLDEEHWIVDGVSECLLPPGKAGPFRTGIRSNAAVDRLTGAHERHSTACLEFRPGAGMWAAVSFAGEAERDAWADLVRAAFRLLADSGFGGERSRGWGRSENPDFVEGTLPEMILSPRPEPAPAEDAPGGPAGPPDPASGKRHWLLALYTPAAGDRVDWQLGNYALVTRGGRVESPAGSGALKKSLRMVTEGSVLAAGDSLEGAATDVAPDGFPHPVFRAGYALSIPLEAQVTA